MPAVAIQLDFDEAELGRNLENRVALITGAGSPIGKVIVRRLIDDGATVALGDVDESALTPLLEEIGGETPYVLGDLGKEELAEELVRKTRDRYGRIDILVNNAGGGIIRPFLEHTPETLRETINRNLLTALWCCLYALPVMVENSYGRIVNIGADSVRNGLPNHAGYNAAKGGVHAMTTGLAREFARYDITVNTVAPSMVATPRAKRVSQEQPELYSRYLEIIPKGRAAELEEVADMVAYLATSGASFVTGQVISVNGGSTML